MTSNEFWDATLREFSNRLIGKEKADEVKFKNEWERTRWQTVALLNIHLDKKTQIKDVKKFLTFGWEKQPEIEPVMSKEERLKMIESWDNEIQVE